MSTTIGYLEALREDLLDAGWRESLPRGGRRRARGGGRRISRRWVVALAAVVGLLGISGVGLIATGGGYLPQSIGGPTERPVGQTVASPAPHPASDEEGAQFGAISADDEQSYRAVLERASSALTWGSSGGGNATAETAPQDVRGIAIGDLSLVIKTARLSVVVERDAFADRYQDAIDVATTNGGYVQQSSTQGDRFGSLVIRVPADRFETTLRELKELGTRVEGQTVTGDDVTAEYVDMRSRLRIAKARRTVLFELMDRAVSIEQTLRVQNALDDVQLRIEQLQGAMNVLENKVSEATIRLQIREPGVQPFEQDAKNPSIPGAFDRAIAGFFAVIAGAVIGLGYLIPVLVIGLAIFFAVRFARRRFA